MKKTILITGGNGFLGHHLVKVLLPDFNILVLEHKLSDFNRLSNDLDKIKIFRYQIDDIEKIFKNVSVNYVLHTATDYGRNTSKSFVAPTNLCMPLKILDTALYYNVECFINTDTVLDRFVSDYALSKNHFREWLFHKRDKIKVINIQLEHFYGPGAGKNNFVTMMINRLLNNEKEIELTAGEQERDFVYYEDVIYAYQLIISDIHNLSNYSNFQVASGNFITIKNLIELMKELTVSKSELKFGALPYRQSELMHSATDNSKLLNLGWQPRIDIYTGLQKVINDAKIN